ncbi:MAG: hypothetical protein M3131_09950 [Actinomycetota bacterium]|nr:hypothetical protein [Actinomycetota bacterium]
MSPKKTPYPRVRVQVVGRTAELIKGDFGKDEDGNFREPIEKPKPRPKPAG